MGLVYQCEGSEDNAITVNSFLLTAIGLLISFMIGKYEKKR